MTDHMPEVRLTEIERGLADTVTNSAESPDWRRVKTDLRWLISEVQRLQTMTDVVPVGEAAVLLNIKPESVRHLMRRHGITEVRGYPRAAVTGLQRTPPGRKPLGLPAASS